MRDWEKTEGRSYRDLLVWQRAMDLTLAVYETTRRWPTAERFGLIDQARRAAASVPANIAEGHGRTGHREFLHHCSIANGSLSEVETHLILAHRLAYLDQSTHDHLIAQTTEVARLLHGLMRHLRERAGS